MKKNKIVLFTLLLSIIGVVGSTKAASVNEESRSFRIENSANSELVQSSSSINGKGIRLTNWTLQFQNFKKGDKIKILLPSGKFNGQTTTIKVYINGKLIGQLTLTHGDAYAVVVFNANANSDDISQFISNFGNFNFGAIGAGGIIDIGGGTINGGTINASSISSVNLSSVSSNRNSGNLGSLASIGSLASGAISSKSKSSANSTSSSKIISIPASSSSKISEPNDGSVHHPNGGPGPVIINPSMSAWSSSVTTQYSNRKSSSSIKSTSEFTSVKDEGKGIRRHSISVQSKSIKRLSHNVSSRTEEKLTADKTNNDSKIGALIDQSGRLHLTKQQIRRLQDDTRFENSKASKAARETKCVMNTNNQKNTIRVPVKATIRNGKITIHREKEKAGKHSASHIRRVNLPIRGILPATRMDKNTWLYSLIGLLIMIVSGKELFAKNRK